MKKIALVLCAGLLLASFAGCGAKPKETAPKAESSVAASSVAASSTAAAAESKVDAVTSASLTSDPKTLVKALSKDGTWISCILSDVKVDEEIKVDGEFHDKADATKKIYRKLALYAQDADHKVTATYTLTAPKMTVTSPAFRIQNGVFKGDVFVNADGFELADSTIEGNVTFATEANKTSAILDTGKVTGTISVGK